MLKCTSNSGAHTFWGYSEVCVTCKATKVQIGCKHEWKAKVPGGNHLSDPCFCVKCKYTSTPEKISKLTKVDPYQLTETIYKALGSVSFKDAVAGYVNGLNPAPTLTQKPFGCKHSWVGTTSGYGVCSWCKTTCNHHQVKLHEVCPICGLLIVSDVAPQVPESVQAGCKHTWGLTVGPKYTAMKLLSCLQCGIKNDCQHVFVSTSPASCKHCGVSIYLIGQAASSLWETSPEQSDVLPLPQSKPARIKLARLISAMDLSPSSSKFKNQTHAVLHSLAQMLTQLETDGVQSFETLEVKTVKTHDGLKLTASVDAKARPEDW